jgi:hypothetical protein
LVLEEKNSWAIGSHLGKWCMLHEYLWKLFVCLSHWNFANKRCRRVSFIMFWPIVEKLLNIEQFCHWKSNEIIIKVLGEIVASFSYGYEALYEWDFLEMILSIFGTKRWRWYWILNNFHQMKLIWNLKYFFHNWTLSSRSYPHLEQLHIHVHTCTNGTFHIS